MEENGAEGDSDNKDATAEAAMKSLKMRWQDDLIKVDTGARGFHG